MELDNLSSVRREMCQEIEQDIRDGTLYISQRLTDRGKEEWPKLLLFACEKYDSSWLADTLKSKNLFNDTELRNGKPVKVPSSAASTLSNGEFNRFYCRGVCLYAFNNGLKFVEVYRALPVREPRPESQVKIGTRIDPEKLLFDLRENPGVDTALGIPAGPNSGLSVRIP